MVKYIQINLYSASLGGDSKRNPTSISGHANITFVENGNAIVDKGYTIGATTERLSLGNAVSDGSGTDGKIVNEDHLLERITRKSKLVPVTDEQYDHLLEYARSQENKSYDYGLFSAACTDFVQSIYEATGHPGHFGILFNHSDIIGPVAVRIKEGILITHAGSARDGGFTWGTYKPQAPVPWENGPVTPRPFITDNCFGAEVPIDMWPLDPEFAPEASSPHEQYDQDAVRAKIWSKPISDIKVGDYVVSHDKNGNLVPGYVPRTMVNHAKILLDFHGTRVTPGHVYYRPDSQRADKYETLIDILRDDGMIEDRDGVKLRAATHAPVGGPLDGFVQAVTGAAKADGSLLRKDAGRIRLGTRFIVGHGSERRSFSVAELIQAGGGAVGEDELIRVGDGPAMPFLWEFGDTLPKPEDFVLACSGTTLEDIYRAAEWESQGPRMGAPMVLDRGPVQPLKGVARQAMPRNEPLGVVHSPVVSAKPQSA